MGVRNTRRQKSANAPEPTEEFSLRTPPEEPNQFEVEIENSGVIAFISEWYDDHNLLTYFIFDFKHIKSGATIARVDPCHGTIHQHYLNERGETVGAIVTIAPYTESNWQAVLNSKYSNLYDEYIISEAFALKALEKWRKNGK